MADEINTKKGILKSKSLNDLKQLDKKEDGEKCVSFHLPIERENGENNRIQTEWVDFFLYDDRAFCLYTTVGMIIAVLLIIYFLFT